MKELLLMLMILSFYFFGCNEDNLGEDLIDSKITAKERINEVIVKAQSDFAADAQLSAIYGREVNTAGEIDLANTSSLSAFVYIMQSDQLQSNEFYVPLFGAGPVKSPINFSTMLSFIKDSTAGNILSSVFSRLATVAIHPDAVYDDSPLVISKALNAGGNVFMNQNAGSKIDMFLLPGKSIDTTLTVSNTADWIVNFHSSDNSLVFWIRGDDVTVISGN